MFWNRKEQKALAEIQAAVDRHVRNQLSNGVTVKVGQKLLIGEFAELELTVRHSMVDLSIKGEFITPAAYQGLWVMDAGGYRKIMPESGKTVFPWQRLQSVRISSDQPIGADMETG